MSAMLDTYDMQMLDYSGDLDVHMDPSSSDAWFQDEAKMEEDGPPLLKHENENHLKTDAFTHEKVDGTIEVDMEPSQDLHNTEYDMLDDDEIQSGEILDIEVYDASHVQSPAMFALDSEQGETFYQHALNDTAATALIEPLNPPLESSDTHIAASDEPLSTAEAFVQPQVLESEPEEQHVVDSSEPATELAGTIVDPGPELHTTEAHEASSEDGDRYIPDGDVSAIEPPALESVEQSEVDGPLTHVQSDDNHTHDNAVLADVHDATETVVISGDNASSGDPHEISEGVYIDPPPPVLLSVGPDDEFNCSFFNEPSNWNEGGQKDAEAKHIPHILLHHLPTLYYEPLSAVFEALRREEFIRSLFPMAETELVLEAADLRLTLSEDNIYTREVTLHELNVLHDVSGINGLLRMRLFPLTTPRFSTRYQHLQNEVSRLDLGLSGEGLPADANARNILSHEDQLETLEAPKEDEVAEDQITHEQESIHEENQTIEEGDKPLEGQALQQYEEQEQVSEPISIVQEQSEEFHVNDEATSSDGPKPSEEKNANDLLLTQDDSSSNQHIEVSSDNDNESQTPTHHSTPTSGSREIGESVHDDEDAGVIALEAVEAHLHDVGYAEDVHPFVGENKSQHELQYPEYDEEDQGEFGDEDYQNEDQEHQSQREVNQEEGEGDEQRQTQQERQEGTQLDDFEGHHEIQGPEDAVQFSAAAADKPEPLISDGAPEPEFESIYEQTSTLGEGTNYGEGDYADDVDATFDHSAITEPTEELTHVEEAEQIIHDTVDSLDPQPAIPEFVGEGWDDDLDGEGEIDDDTWEEDNEVETAQSNSNNSSVTLSSKASKRSYDELESDGDAGEGDSYYGTPPSSPGPKRSRTQ